ncbi:hypothetical protein GCM10007877_16210 [Marinibactrum halimedae]|uniref:Uncharacterized protein n=2 Tax=Marinibactrum halimedae TaxID=1444977 RepID=A0AA37T7B5_9GAMM|nr:hypothetical protein GCM10007877_16210 [Marinibactrum halimedae]
MDKLLECADSDDGFVIEGVQLLEFFDELQQLEKLWHTDNDIASSNDLLRSLIDKKNRFEKAICIAREHNLSINVC